MTRNRASAKQAGTAFETLIVGYLAEHVDKRIERRRLNGSKDRGDVSGLYIHGEPVVIEAKNCARVSLGPWVKEAEIARGNADALAGIVAHKRTRHGNPADQFITMTLADLVALINGTRPVVAGLADTREV